MNLVSNYTSWTGYSYFEVLDEREALNEETNASYTKKNLEEYLMERVIGEKTGKPVEEVLESILLLDGIVQHQDWS